MSNDFQVERRAQNLVANNDVLLNLQRVVAQQESILNGQQQLMARQQQQLDSMQDQLGMLTEVATKLAVMEERRGEDKANITKLDDRVTKLHERVSEKFPQYDTLVEAYKALNNKLWAALGTAIISLIMGASKLGVLTGGG